MSADHHDRVMAMTSHIPQLIAYSIVATASELETHVKDEVIKYSAAGFRDFTRLAGSDPIMWRDVYSMNKDAVLEMLGRFTEDLSTLQKAIRNNDTKFLEKTFSSTREIRKIIEKLQESNIKVVLFITPLHENFISSIHESEKRKLYDIVNKSAKDFNLDVYDFHDKYAELPIWLDVNHVAYHKDSMIYSDDVAEMIILELNKIKT